MCWIAQWETFRLVHVCKTSPYFSFFPNFETQTWIRTYVFVATAVVVRYGFRHFIHAYLCTLGISNRVSKIHISLFSIRHHLLIEKKKIGFFYLEMESPCSWLFFLSCLSVRSASLFLLHFVFDIHFTWNHQRWNSGRESWQRKISEKSQGTVWGKNNSSLTPLYFYFILFLHQEFVNTYDCGFVAVPFKFC